MFEKKLIDVELCPEGKTGSLHVVEHLTSCESCRNALDRFQALFPLLSMFTQGKKLSALLAEKLAEYRKEK